MITSQLATAVFPNEDPVGKEIHVGELAFTVIGVFRERIGDIRAIGDHARVGDRAVLADSLLHRRGIHQDILRAGGQAGARGNGNAAGEGNFEQPASAEVEYRVENLASILETARHISMAMTIVLVVIAMIALAISGIGIMNIMLVTVTERTREIGIRKAVGANRAAILYQFLLEALMISGTGALTGIAIAVAIPFLLEALLSLFPVPQDIHVPISWISVVIAFVVSCSTGLIFGYLPANKAAQLQPTDSLRYE